jgi:hypothetical protein
MIWVCVTLKTFTKRKVSEWVSSLITRTTPERYDDSTERTFGKCFLGKFPPAEELESGYK